MVVSFALLLQLILICIFSALGLGCDHNIFMKQQRHTAFLCRFLFIIILGIAGYILIPRIAACYGTDWRMVVNIIFGFVFLWIFLACSSYLVKKAIRYNQKHHHSEPHISSDNTQDEVITTATVSSVQVPFDYSLLPMEEIDGYPPYCSLTLREFKKLRYGNGIGDFSGVYVIENLDDGRCYVGQSVHVLARLSQHLQGRGCPDVYVDYRSHKPFIFHLCPLYKSGYRSLNSLEKQMIALTKAYDMGYNRTRGNADIVKTD